MTTSSPTSRHRDEQAGRAGAVAFAPLLRIVRARPWQRPITEQTVTRHPAGLHPAPQETAR